MYKTYWMLSVGYDRIGPLPYSFIGNSTLLIRAGDDYRLYYYYYPYAVTNLQPNELMYNGVYCVLHIFTTLYVGLLR